LLVSLILVCLFFFTDSSPSEFYPLSLHDALPIFLFSVPTVDSSFTECQVVLKSSLRAWSVLMSDFTYSRRTANTMTSHRPSATRDRKSTRLNSSHLGISYAVFCLKKKKKKKTPTI